MGRLNYVKMASFLYGLTLWKRYNYNVLLTLLFCLLKTLLERVPRHSEAVIYLYTQVEPAESDYEANI